MSASDPGPARAGGLLYAKDKESLSGFYEKILGMRRLVSDKEHDVLGSADFQLIIHTIPAEIAGSIAITVPPAIRETTAVKLFFTVGSLTKARRDAKRLGGRVFTEQWDGPGFIVCQAYDPEGNVFQVRESVV